MKTVHYMKGPEKQDARQPKDDDDEILASNLNQVIIKNENKRNANFLFLLLHPLPPPFLPPFFVLAMVIVLPSHVLTYSHMQ